MRKILCSLLVLGLAGISACGASRPDTARIAEPDLLHHRFVIEDANGVAFTERVPFIQFGEDMLITGQICNNFRGKAELKDGVLTMPLAAATMMMCPDAERNAFERDLFKMLSDGANASYKGNTLTLENNGKVFRFSLRDLPQ